MVRDKEEGKKGGGLGSEALAMGLESDLKAFLSDKPKKEELRKNEEKGFAGSKLEVKTVDGRWWNGKCVQVYSGVKDEDDVVGKRKRESYLGMMNWIKAVAKNPCNPAIGCLPDRNKWKNYGSELPWKQILSVREKMLLKKNADASSQQSVWQKRQKMHPSMYEGGSERQRCSQRLQVAKDSSRKPREQLISESSSSGSQEDDTVDKQSDSTADSLASFGHRKKRVRMGPQYQADVPEFQEEAYEPDSKWLGARIWPLDKGERVRGLIERDPIGKGRQESCGCQFPCSPECVRFHIREKRTKVKLEVGSAFYKWKFDGMGEEVALSWKKEEEKKFENVVNSNRLSSDKYFWDELFKCFAKKGREALVSYYFNVFLLRRRILQNRDTTNEIDSDDDESEYGPVGDRFGQEAANTPGSIFCSPKKSHLNGK